MEVSYELEESHELKEVTVNGGGDGVGGDEKDTTEDCKIGVCHVIPEMTHLTPKHSTATQTT